jgi:hypothetical protein
VAGGYHRRPPRRTVRPASPGHGPRARAAAYRV